ncbi:MAG TPA: zf-HC2 domain-containing protein [Streptosporangiaceae bacterium]|jgi:anti-sigma factor RsiW
MMGMLGRTSDHEWSQRHLSHYVEGELRPRARRRLDRHARGCTDCGRGIRAMRALVYAVQGLDGLAGVRAPAAIFDRVRLAGASGSASSQHA